MPKTSICLCLILSLTSQRLYGANLRVSFLTNDVVLAETVGILKAARVTDNGIKAFEAAVHDYYREPLKVNPSGFPAEGPDGFFEFGSAADFVNALPHRLSETEHEFGVNCFATVLHLVEGWVYTAIDVDRVGAPFLAACASKGSPRLRIAATAQDAFSATYPAWYRREVVRIVGQEWTRAHIGSTACFYTFHALPRGVAHKDLEKVVWAVLRSRWKARGVHFSTDLQLVLLHRARPEYGIILTDHAGLLVKTDDKMMYLEKAGGRGPFLRMDVADAQDLVPFYGGKLTPAMVNEYPDSFMSVNDAHIWRMDARGPESDTGEGSDTSAGTAPPDLSSGKGLEAGQRTRDR